MLENREQAILETLKWEGGYSNNPQDPGGPTNWGITLHDAQTFWKKNATAKDVKTMPKAIAMDIYRSKYWKTAYYDCDKLASGVDLAVFDFGVNSGPLRAYQYLMDSVGGTDVQTINKICDKRLAFLKGLSTWSTFGTGWTRRVSGIRQAALALAGKRPIIKKEHGIWATITAAVAGTLAWFGAHWEVIVLGTLAAGTLAYLALSIYEYNRRNDVVSN